MWVVQAVPGRVIHALLFVSLIASGGATFAQTKTAVPPAADGRTAADPTVPVTVVKTTANGEPEPWQIGGAISAPVLLHSVEPQYTEEARSKKLSGTVQVNFNIDEQGNTADVRVVRGVGAGLDERAIEAVKQYKFTPAMQNGKPVVVELDVKVSFQIFSDQAAAQQADAGNPASGSPAGGSRATGSQAAVAPKSAVDASGLKTIADRQRYVDDPKFQKAIDDVRLGRMPVDERLARWKHANNIADNECVACLHAIIALQMNASQWKDAVTSGRQLDAVGPDAKDRYYAESQMGIALMHANNDHPKPEQVQEALASLQSAVALSVGNKAIQNLLKMTVYTEGRALALLNRDAEASAMFQKYVDMVAYTDSYRARAEHFIENPKLAAMPMAPPFALTTSEGEMMSLDDMGGKVVLLDFWATWCGPCKVTLPEIQKIARDFAGEPLVVISISSDTDDIAWKAFVEKNNMDWPQYRDANGALSRAYSVSSIPRFFTIDTDGVLQSVKVGSGANVTGDIRKLVNKALDAEKKKVKESQRAAAGE